MNLPRLFVSLVFVATLALPVAALEWQQMLSAPARIAKVVPNGTGKSGFTALAPEQAGIRFTNTVTEERGLTNQIYYGGSGVAAGDVDGDGWVDLYFCSLEGRNVLYRNRGNWQFDDVSGQAGIACPDQASTGAVFADVDGNGHLDLLVSSLGHGVRLFLNDGGGRFTENTLAAGLASDHASMTMTLADVEGDGDLDLYVANNRKDTVQDEIGVRFFINMTNGVAQVAAVNDRPTTAPDLTNRFYIDAQGGVQENAEADVLYLNDGTGKFVAASWTDGTFLDEDGKRLTGPQWDWGLSAMFRDMNHDGAPDLYVCNDGESPDRIWMNDGRGRFRALPKLALRKTCLSSMGVDFADINHDGLDDFFVADMLSYDHQNRQRQMPTRVTLSRAGEIEPRVQVPRNTLFLNRGDGTYAEIGQFSGVEASDWSWCPVFLDVDLDGHEDLIITTGLEKNLRDADSRFALNQMRRSNRLTKREFLAQRRTIGSFRTSNFAFRNRGDLTFENVSASWGFTSKQASHGISMADLDNDGDLDVVVACLNAPPLLYRNETSAARVAVRLKGQEANRQAIGARITVTGGPTPQSQEMISGGRYLSGDDAFRMFAAGLSTNLTVTVRWRNGVTTSVTNVPANAICEITEPVGPAASFKTETSGPVPLFSDASALLAHRNFETEFDDFARQPTLTKRLSTAGPGIAWCDFDGDGRDDLIVGTGRGGTTDVFRNESGGFQRMNLFSSMLRAEDDVLGLVTWPLGSGTNLLLLAQANYETGSSNALLMHNVSGAAPQIARAAGWDSSAGAMCMADIDGRGRIVVFVAGRVKPGRYPEAASSKIFRVKNGTLEPEEMLSAAFANIGLVNSAIFSDLDGDGMPELVLACEWDSLRVFRLRDGRFVEITRDLGLDSFRGWWQGLASGDFDGDGRMDLVAANWGRNHRYARFLAKPVEVFFSGARIDGTVEMFEAYHAPEMNKLVPARHWETFAFRLPYLQTRIRSFSEFSQLGMDDIFKDAPVEFHALRANTFDSMVFLNRGNHFEAVALPAEAQFAPAFGVCVADFNGDAREDIFLTQNFFGGNNETSRDDAGRGLLLLGNGAGRFRSVSAAESGITIYGEGRGVAACDYDGDGRVDLCVGQNSGETKLYHNEKSAAGLRVRLRGPAANANAIGALLRIGNGPAREMHCGSGHLSLDSVAQVMARNESDVLTVRWPGGKTTTNQLPVTAQEVLIDWDGKLTHVR
ncbi:MAG TPA: VCBS repeat-containing protein [Methylomirabilota bacterium]|nr:VCBS repeat-containing protein [Methylomirabilota bacterium]